MAIYASSNTRGTQRVDVVTLGTVSAPLAALATGQQLFVARAARPNAGIARPMGVQTLQPQLAPLARREPEGGPETSPGLAHDMAVQSSTSVPSGQRT